MHALHYCRDLTFISVCLHEAMSLKPGITFILTTHNADCGQASAAPMSLWMRGIVVKCLSTDEVEKHFLFLAVKWNETTGMWRLEIVLHFELWVSCVYSHWLCLQKIFFWLVVHLIDVSLSFSTLSALKSLITSLFIQCWFHMSCWQLWCDVLLGILVVDNKRNLSVMRAGKTWVLR